MHFSSKVAQILQAHRDTHATSSTIYFLHELTLDQHTKRFSPASPPPSAHIHTRKLILQESIIPPEQTPSRQTVHDQPVTRRPPASSRHHTHTRNPHTRARTQRTHILTQPPSSDDGGKESRVTRSYRSVMLEVEAAGRLPDRS